MKTAVTVMDRSAVATSPSLSVTWMVKFQVPGEIGVPEIIPEEESSNSPSGKVPDAMDQV
jgi:hypothetical protein